MIQNNRKMNSEINVEEIFWRYFEQWKAVLLFSLAVALLVTGLKYASDTTAYKENSDEPGLIVDVTDVKGSIENILSSLPEADREAVEKLVKEKNLLDTRKDYYDNSIVFNLDPTNCRVLRLQYDVKAEKESDKRTLIDAYWNTLINEDSISALKEEISPESDNKYIYELFTALGYGDTEKGLTGVNTKDSLIISILLPETSDANAVKEVITELLISRKDDLTKLISDNEVKIISDEIVRYPSIELAQEQSSILNTVITAQTNYNKSYAELSESQREAYDIIESMLTPDSIELSVSENTKPGISKRAFAGGFICGALIYGVILGLLILLRRRIISPADTRYYPGVCELFEFNNNTPQKGLLSSNIVSKLRKKKRASIEEQINACTDEISLICSSNKLEKITLMSPGGMSEKCDALIKEVCDKLTLEGIDASIMETDNPDMNANKKELAGTSTVIPILVEDKTKLDGFNDFMNLCKHLNCDVMGTIYYGER